MKHLRIAAAVVSFFAWRRVVALLPFTNNRAFLSNVRPSSTQLYGGFGVATNYTWTEEPFEMEVTVQVPPNTRAKDIVFRALPNSIDLRLKSSQDDVESVLLDKDRILRGKVQLDGTFWVISDSEEDNSLSRRVTVTIEKNIRGPRDDFDVVDYDWKGVYPDDEEEVSQRQYQEPEELNVREYAASLGVDIDNINMSMVDKTMFNSGLNMTRNTMDQLSKAGYVEEVTQQSDGSEFTINDDGESVPYSRLGRNIAEDEIRDASSPSKIPFLDTDSRWHRATVPMDELTEVEDSNVDTDSETGAQDRAQSSTSAKNTRSESDPIDSLTVKRLKDILCEQGLKVTGNKQELRERLRRHIQSVAEDQKTES